MVEQATRTTRDEETSRSLCSKFAKRLLCLAITNNTHPAPATHSPTLSQSGQAQGTFPQCLLTHRIVIPSHQLAVLRMSTSFSIRAYQPYLSGYAVLTTQRGKYQIWHGTPDADRYAC